MVGVPVRQDDEIEIGEINALCFHVGGKCLTVIASVEQNSLASDLNEREKPQSFFIAASVPKASYRIVILDSAAAASAVTAVKTAALASTAKAIVCVVFIIVPSSINSAPYPEQGLGVEAAALTDDPMWGVGV